MKLCIKCKIKKELNEFQKNHNAHDGLCLWCKQCKSEYDKKYRRSDKIQALYKSEEYRSKKRIASKIRRDTNYIYNMYKLAKSRALKKGIPFNIEVLDIEIPEFCPLLGSKIVINGGRRGYFENSPSLDRIIPAKGYVKGNIMVMSAKANAMKNNASIEQLLTFSENIKRLYGDFNSSLSTNNFSTS